MIKYDIASLGRPIEKFESYENIKNRFVAGEKMALLAETTFRARVFFNKFKEIFSQDELKTLEITELQFVHPSGGVVICLRDEQQLEGFEGVLIN